MHSCPPFQTIQSIKHSPLLMQNSRIVKKINSRNLPKLMFLGIVFILSFTGTATFAQSQQVELGIILGKPTGISYKYWTSTNTAFDIAAARDFADGSLYLHGDVLFHHYDILPVTTGRLPLYYGIGPAIGVPEILVGVRIPVGLTYLFEGVPLSLFFELAPGLTFFPGTGFLINGGIGVRYIF